MKFVEYVQKFKFNEKLNVLDYKFEKIIFNIKYKECKEFRNYFWVTLSRTFLCMLLICGFCIFAGWCCEEIDVGAIMAVLFGTASLILGFCSALFGWDFFFESKEEKQKWFEKEESYRKIKENNSIEIAKCEEWRKNHPFEESVRKALESKNSNDVADVIKMILERDTI